MKKNIAALSLTLLPLLATAQPLENYSAVTDARLTNPEPANWLMYRRTYDGWGHSPLDSINTRNVVRLTPVWTLSTGVNEGHESPPIVNDGIMFVTTPFNRLIAIEASTGRVRWAYQRQLPADMQMAHPTNRGAALYGDKIFMATSDAKLVAFDAKTGTVLWEKEVAD